MNCVKCSNEIVDTYSNKDDLIKHSMCHTCDYWMRRVNMVNSRTQVIVKGCMYQVGSEINDPHAFQGFGGRKFKIKFFDGRTVETSNLWCNGNIPEHFRDELKDNAKFEEVETRRINHGEGFYSWKGKP